MQQQKTDYDCGPAALHNALHVLRSRVSLKRISELAGTSEAEGTDEEGLKRAILAFGFVFDEIAYLNASKAWGHLWFSLLAGRPVLLCVDRFSHWVVAIGFCGKTILLFDSQRTPPCGLIVTNRDRLLRRWRAARRVRGRGPRYYGLAVGPNS